MMTRFAWLGVLVLCAAAHAAEPRQHVAVTAQEPAGAVLVERLRKGGLVLFFRHADTRGMPCVRLVRYHAPYELSEERR